MITLSSDKTTFCFKQFSCSCIFCVQGAFDDCLSGIPVLKDFPKKQVFRNQQVKLSDSRPSIIEFEKRKLTKKRKNQSESDSLLNYELNVSMTLEEIDLLTRLSKSDDRYEDFRENAYYGSDIVDQLCNDMCYYSDNARVLDFGFTQKIISGIEITPDELSAIKGNDVEKIPNFYLLPLFSNQTMAIFDTLDIRAPEIENYNPFASGHWAMLCLSIENEVVYYVDSLGQFNDFFSYSAVINIANDFPKALGMNFEPRFVYLQTPQQVQNDCGALLLSYVELIITGQIQKLMKSVSFHEEYIKLIRLSHLSNWLNREFSPSINCREVRDFGNPQNESTPTVSTRILSRRTICPPSGTDSPVKKRKN